MKLGRTIENIGRWIAGDTPVAPATHRPGRRSGVMGQIANNRLTPASWRNLRPLEQLMASNYIIRERARHLEKTNDFAEKFLLEFEANVVGPDGFVFQSYVRELQKVEQNWQWVEDDVANNKIEEAFTEFSRAQHFSVTGDMNRREFERVAARTWARDGEVFIRSIPFPADEEKFGSRLQLIEPELVDEFLNTVNKANGNIIKQGVEIDKYRRPVAYYVRKKTQASELWGAMALADYDIIPASQMFHLFLRKWANQVRGISLLVQSMVRLQRLSDYEEAVLVNAEISAKKMGFFSDKSAEESTDLTVGAAVTATDANGNQYETGDQLVQVEAGSFEDIGAKQFTPFAPEFPTQQHGPFFDTTMHGVSAGLGAGYSAITNDLGKTSYSSGRIGLQNERELWKMRQGVMVDRFLAPMFARWLEFAILAGAVKLPMEKLEKFNAPVFVGRRWDWVDPLKDIMAAALSCEYGFDTRTSVLASKGKDIKEVNSELAKEQKEAAEAGVVLKFNTELAKIASAPDPAEEDGAANKTNEPARMDENELLVRAVELLMKKRNNGHHKETVPA